MPLDIDRFAHTKSPIQQWNVKIKIFSLGIFIFGAALLKTIPFTLIALCVSAIFIFITKIPIKFIMGGLKWVFYFLVPFVLILPFSYPGTAAFHIIGLPFAWEGLRIAILIFIKANAIVLTSYSIFGTSRFDVSMIGLQELRCPTIMVQMLLFTYRYTFVFLNEMKRMNVAMSSRGFVKKFNIQTLTITGNFVGTLLVRSFERTDRIYKAMLSKGFHGEFYSLVKFETSFVDYVKASIVLSIILSLIVGDIWGPYTSAKIGWY